MKVVPLNDKILVKRLEAEDKTKGGILLPDSAKEKPRQGKVLAVGEGRRLESGNRVTMTVKWRTRSCSARGPARKSPSMGKSIC